MKGKLLIIDDARPDGTRSMTLESVEASLVIRAEQGQADLHVSSGYEDGKSLSGFSLGGTISAAQRQTIALSDSSARQTMLQFEGTVEATNLKLREMVDFFSGRVQPRSTCRAPSI